MAYVQPSGCSLADVQERKHHIDIYATGKTPRSFKHRMFPPCVIGLEAVSVLIFLVDGSQTSEGGDSATEATRGHAPPPGQRDLKHINLDLSTTPTTFTPWRRPWVISMAASPARNDCRIILHLVIHPSHIAETLTNASRIMTASMPRCLR
jgi:hypothetical protein